MQRDKLTSYVGFAVRSGAAVYGLENIKKSYKKIFCVIEDEMLSENSRSKTESFCKEKSIKKIVLKNIDELFGANNCKVVGITNKELAKQIINVKE